MSNHGIITYPDAQAVQKQLDDLIKKPIYSIAPDALKKYEEEYFDKKCAKSKAMIEEAKQVIPGGVQHNLAFNYPFPLAHINNKKVSKIVKLIEAGSRMIPEAGGRRK